MSSPGTDEKENEDVLIAPDYKVIDNIDVKNRPIKVGFSDYGPLHLNVKTLPERPGFIHVSIYKDVENDLTHADGVIIPADDDQIEEITKKYAQLLTQINEPSDAFIIENKQRDQWAEEASTRIRNGEKLSDVLQDK
jgi:hypothetical protein